MSRTLPLLPLLVVLACSDNNVNVVVRNLDGPTDIAFGCVGDLRLIGSGDVVHTAQPLASCTTRLEGEIPPGQEDVPLAPDLYAFVLQQTRGTIAVIDIFAGTVADSDPFAPGRNAIPIGTLPVGLVEDQSGCFVMTANAGSCDLSALDVASAVSLGEPAQVTRISITNASGEIMRAKPRAIEKAQLPSETIGVDCASAPAGRVYVTFPECNLVAAIDSGTGQMEAGIRVLEDGNAEITDGNVTCPNQCGTGSVSNAVPRGLTADAGVPDAGVLDLPQGAPVAVKLSPDGSRLYIGNQNSPVLTVVDLDADGLPVQLQRVVLEGDVGISTVDVSNTISMGGAFDSIGQVGVDFTFAYVVATDGSIRVVDVDGLVECDTQVDPRYLRGISNIELLACMPVGDPATPPRRAGARGPGIRLPSDAIPLDLEIVEVDSEETASSPTPIILDGTFGFVTSSDGNTFVINIDDNIYPDFEIPEDPTRVWMTLALPHQLRDFLTDRDYVQINSCVNLNTETFELPPRLVGDVGTGYGFDPKVSQDKDHLLPTLRRVECVVEDTSGSEPVVTERASVSELGLAAPIAVRDLAYPDLRMVNNEDWFVSWEGSLSLDAPNVAIDGRPVRAGVMDNNQGVVTVTEAGAPFCGLGVEEYDILQIVGCDPSRGDEQCGIGETCYVHPATPSSVSTGMCMPTDQVDALAGPCRDVLVTNRRYTIHEARAGQLVLGERARVLRTTPVDGCTSDDECSLLADQESRIGIGAHPVEIDNGIAVVTDSSADYSWSCQPDDSRKPGPSRCVMTCQSAGDCEPGSTCSGGICVEGKLPPDVCTQAVQRYQLRAGEAFAVVGSVSGYIHNRTADPSTGECIVDPDAAPTAMGRIPLDAPACSGDGATDLVPNPCLTMVSTYDEVTPFEARGSGCVAQAEAGLAREQEAIRFSNPVFTIHLVNLSTTGDEACNGDGQGTLPPNSPLFEDFGFGFTVVGGFIPHFVAARSYRAEFPIRIRRGPSGLLWIMDQGDDRDPTQLTRGRVLTIDPGNAADGFGAYNAFL